MTLKKIQFAALTVLTMVAFSCKKDDTVAPVITLNGDNPMVIAVGTSFTDPGATATDDVDGDLTADIIADGTVNANAAGSYTITYSVSDAAGNSASAERRVDVVLDRDDYLGAYTVSHNCSQPYALATNPSFTAGANANEVDVALFYYNGGTCTLVIDGNDVSVAAGQAPTPVGVTVTGNGTMNAAGTALTMNYTFTPNQGTPVSCTATYTKN